MSIRVIDVASPSGVKDVVQTGYGVFFANAARTSIVYTLATSAQDPKAAVFARPVP